MDEASLQGEIDKILSARQQMLPQVNEAIGQAKRRAESVDRLLALVQELEATHEDEADRLGIHHAKVELERMQGRLASRVSALGALRTRYARETINIGVSGEARVGKSTTLQKLSGLTDTQIPAGDGLPVTAVRSEIFNASDDYAEVTFRDQASFIAEYIEPLLAVINRSGSQDIKVRSLSDLRSVNLPDHLGNNVDSVTADCLKRLKDAKRSLATYDAYLTGRVERIGLDDLRKFVAYPTNEDITAEENGGKPASRAYIAVRALKIYCRFPGLDGVKIGLVDLPGLGEIGDSVADMHLSGLEDGVDQVLLIMRPTESEGYVKSGISSNIDQLRRIQPGIRRRADLITAGINVYEGRDQTAQTLEDDFRRTINGAQENDAIELVRFEAIDGGSVANLLDQLLAKIALRLPIMDQEVFEYVLAEQELQDDLSDVLANLGQTVNQVLKTIPLEERWLAGQIDRVSKALKDDYNRYEVELVESAEKAGEWSQGFQADVERIHADTNARITDGFFLGRDRWPDAARGQTDYYVFFREEARRLRREIIAQYSSLDEFYQDHINRLKLNAVDILLGNTGNLRDAFGITAIDDADSRIDKISSELGGSIRDDDVDAAFTLLKSVQFSFRHNVYLNISKHLEALANPDETQEVGYRSHESIRIELGGVTDIDVKTAKLSTYLAKIAHEANDSIKDALLASEDKFGEYLSVCMSFFIDYLYRKDDDNFTHFVVRRLISVYRDLILTDASDMVSDQAKTALIDRIKVGIKEAAVESPAAALGYEPERPNALPATETSHSAPPTLVPEERPSALNSTNPAKARPEAASRRIPPIPPGHPNPPALDNETVAADREFHSNISFGGNP